MPMHIIGTTKTFKAVDQKGRKQFLLKIPAENVLNLITALTELKDGDIALDIRTSEKTGSNGGSFESSFIMVRDYIAKDGGVTAGTSSAKFVPKAKPAQSAVAASQVNRMKASE